MLSKPQFRLGGSADVIIRLAYGEHVSEFLVRLLRGFELLSKAHRTLSLLPSALPVA